MSFFYVPGTGQPREVTGEESGEGAGKSGDNIANTDYCYIVLLYHNIVLCNNRHMRSLCSWFCVTVGVYSDEQNAVQCTGMGSENPSCRR